MRLIKGIFKEKNVVRLLTLCSLIWFILFRSYIVWRSWNGRIMLPEPDDASAYVSLVAEKTTSGQVLPDIPYFFPSSNWHHLAYLPWSINLAAVKLLTNLNFEQTFYANFYFGTLFLSLVLLYLLEVIETGYFPIIGLLVMSLFCGGGSYHGFFWVVPSFYSLTFLFGLTALLYDKSLKWNRKWQLLSTALILAFIPTHPLSKVGLVGMLLSLILSLIFNRNKETNYELMKKGGWLLFIGVLAVFLYEVFPEIIGIILPSSIYIKGIVQQPISFGFSWKVFNEAYIDLFKERYDYLLLLILGIVGLLVNRKNEFLCIFLSFLSLQFLLCLFPVGYRALLYLWPITFITFSYGIYFVIKSALQLACYDGFQIIVRLPQNTFSFKAKGIVTSFLLLLLLCGYIFTFVQYNYDYNVNYADYRRRRNNWYISPDITDFLENVTQRNDLILFETGILYQLLAVRGLENRRYAGVDWCWNQTPLNKIELEGAYVVALTNSDQKRFQHLYDRSISENLTLKPLGIFGFFKIYEIVKQEDSFLRLSFDGETRVELNNSVIGSKNQFSIEASLIPYSLQRSIYGEFHGPTGSTRNYLHITNGFVYFDQYPPSGGSIKSNTRLKENVEWHIVYVQNVSSRAIYINGNLDVSDDNAEKYAGGEPNKVLIGARAYDAKENGFYQYFYGLIKRLRIYPKPLTEEQVKKLYYGEETSLDLMADWDFRKSGSTLVDRSGNGNNGTIINPKFVFISEEENIYISEKKAIPFYELTFTEFILSMTGLFSILFLPGFSWSIRFFSKLKNEILPVSFLLSYALTFLSLLFLNIALKVPINLESVLLSIGINAVFPILIVPYIRKFLS